MKKTINADAVARVTFVPISESDSWKMIPAMEYMPSIFDDVLGFIFQKTIHVPERIGSEYGLCTYSLEEFEGYQNEYFLKDGKIFMRAQVYVEYISGKSTTTYFHDNEKAEKFYNSLVDIIRNEFSYDE